MQDRSRVAGRKKRLTAIAPQRRFGGNASRNARRFAALRRSVSAGGRGRPRWSAGACGRLGGGRGSRGAGPARLDRFQVGMSDARNRMVAKIFANPGNGASAFFPKMASSGVNLFKYRC